MANWNTPFRATQYIIDQKILAIRDTFGIKDTSGNLLAYVKQQLVSFGPKFWYEGTDGRRLGEIHGKEPIGSRHQEENPPTDRVSMVDGKLLRTGDRESPRKYPRT
jgi:uncharacterized protein YxjI